MFPTRNQIVFLTFKIMKKRKLKKGDLELHLQFERCGTNVKEWMQKCSLLLPKIHRRKIWAKKGFGSTYEYAAKLAGMSRWQVDSALWVLNKIEDRPELMKVVEEKGINAVRPVVTISTSENEGFLAEKARELTVRELEVFVRGIKEGKCNDEVSEKLQVESLHVHKSQPVKITLSMELEPEVVEQLKKLKGEKEWSELMKEFMQFREERLESEKPDPVVATSRHVSAEVERFVRLRDGNTCVFPGCFKPCAVLHHVDGFAVQKVHDPDKIYCLCGGHHDLAHRGLIENENILPKFWRVRGGPDRASPRFWVDQRFGEYRAGAVIAN